jgi:LPXTG-site transpeptidase (sortase) family protein
MSYKARYDKTIFCNPANDFCIFGMKSADTTIPREARGTYRYRDGLIRFTVSGYGLPQTDAVEVELVGEWEKTKYGVQLKVSEWEEIMAKGVGHFTETSAWDGNICLAGHNRGAKYTIGTIKDLKIGDIIKYTTKLGTRTYAVNFVKTISNTDWTNTGKTFDNRITLYTCLENQPDYRVCVQAVEVK